LECGPSFPEIEAPLVDQSFAVNAKRLMKPKYAKIFIISAEMIFLVTALAKLVSAGGSARVLNLADPLLSLSTRHVLAGVGVLEMLLAGYLFLGKNLWMKLSLTAWMATNFLVYRLGLWWTDAPKPCGCLGTVTDALPISPRFVDYGMKGVLAYLLIGSVALIVVNAKAGAASPPETATGPIGDAESGA
jgi:hypothetical protein